MEKQTIILFVLLSLLVASRGVNFADESSRACRARRAINFTLGETLLWLICKRVTCYFFHPTA